MKAYGKLVHMELHRVRWLLAALMALTLVIQVAALVWTAGSGVADIREAETIGRSAFFSDDKLSFSWLIFSTQLLFALPILLSIAVLVIYVFLIWYRDWFGRSTFIYRLLTLPTARRNVYFAKATAVLLLILILISFQLILLPLEEWLFKLVVPSDLWEPSTFTDAILANQAFAWVIPLDGSRFLVSIGLGMAGVFALFGAILLERSYRVRGILLALLYLAACLTIVIYPLLTLGIDQTYSYLYPYEILLIELAIIIAVTLLSIWMSLRLLDKKITV
jgi:hypothetical protein